jgi:hypothetical protein
MFIKSFIFFDDTLTFNYNSSRKINFHSSVTINKTPYIIRLYTFRGVSDNIKQTNDRYIETTFCTWLWASRFLISFADWSVDNMTRYAIPLDICISPKDDPTSDYIEIYCYFPDHH